MDLIVVREIEVFGHREPTHQAVLSFDLWFFELDESIAILRGFKVKNILDTSLFCEFDLLKWIFNT